MQKTKKKKKRKTFYGTFFLADFLFAMIKRAEKVKVFFFPVRGEGKCEINIKKRKFFSSFVEDF